MRIDNFTAGGAIGLWLLLANSLLVGTVTSLLGLAILGFQLEGERHPLNYAAGALALFGCAAWSVWLGRLSQLKGLIVWS